MKHLLLAAAAACLFACVWAAWSVFQGQLPREIFLRQVGLLSLGWFVLATRWAYRK